MRPRFHKISNSQQGYNQIDIILPEIASPVPSKKVEAFIISISSGIGVLQMQLLFGLLDIRLLSKHILKNYKIAMLHINPLFS